MDDASAAAGGKASKKWEVVADIAGRVVDLLDKPYDVDIGNSPVLCMDCVCELYNESTSKIVGE